MQTKLNWNRLAGTAIAAVLALTATPALGQETDPLAPATEDTAAPLETATPPAETSTADERAASDSLAPEGAEEAAPAADAATTAAATSERRAATRSPARTAPRATARTTAPAAAAAEPAPVAVEEAASLAATDPTLIAPPIAADLEPMPVQESAHSLALDDALPIAAGAGLGLLLLGGAAAGLRRRRRRNAVAYADVREPVSEPAFARPMHDAPVAHRPAPSPAREMAPSSFMAAPAASTAGLSHTERAKRGPTPENPFLSLKKRLKRAAFFEQRDRAVAAGKAAPVDPTAGLPDRMVKAMAPRPARTANASHPTIRYGGFSYQPA